MGKAVVPDNPMKLRVGFAARSSLNRRQATIRRLMGVGHE